MNLTKEEEVLEDIRRSGEVSCIAPKDLRGDYRDTVYELMDKNRIIAVNLHRRYSCHSFKWYVNYYILENPVDIIRLRLDKKRIPCYNDVIEKVNQRKRNALSLRIH